MRRGGEPGPTLPSACSSQVAPLTVTPPRGTRFPLPSSRHGRAGRKLPAQESAADRPAQGPRRRLTFLSAPAMAAQRGTRPSTPASGAAGRVRVHAAGSLRTPLKGRSRGRRTEHAPQLPLLPVLTSTEGDRLGPTVCACATWGGGACWCHAALALRAAGRCTRAL